MFGERDVHVDVGFEVNEHKSRKGVSLVTGFLGYVAQEFSPLILFPDNWIEACSVYIDLIVHASVLERQEEVLRVDYGLCDTLLATVCTQDERNQQCLEKGKVPCTKLSGYLVEDFQGE